MSRSTWTCEHCGEFLAGIKADERGARRLLPTAKASTAVYESGVVVFRCPGCRQTSLFRWARVTQGQPARMPKAS